MSSRHSPRTASRLVRFARTLNLPSSLILTPIAAALALSLTACGGGGGSGGGVGTSIKLAGAAIDAPIDGAQIQITSGAPASAGGTAIGTFVTTQTDGSFTLDGVTLPAGSVPIFANATAPNPTVVLSSYLGQSDALAAAGSVSSANLPDLDISPVTTAALAVYAQTNGKSYAGLTPTTYAMTLTNYRNDILAIAAGIKAVGDKLCLFTPLTTTTTGTTTTSLANYLAAQSNLTTATSTLHTVGTTLGSGCATVLAALPGEISADPYFSPELDLGDVIDANIAPVVPAGTYQIEGVIAGTGTMNAIRTTTGGGTSNNTLPAVPLAASVFVNTAVTVDSLGNISSQDTNVLSSGPVIGNFATLAINANNTTYTLRVKLGVLPSTVVNNLGSSSAFVVEGGGTDDSGLLTSFEGVLAPTAAIPDWQVMFAGNTDSSMDGVHCPSSNGIFPVRIDASFFGTTASGGSFGECITPYPLGMAAGAPVLTMSAPISNQEDFGFDHSGLAMNIMVPLSAPTWTEYTTTSSGITASIQPFILTSTAQYTPPGSGSATITGTAYYVMGAHTIVFSSADGNGLFSLTGHAFHLNRLVGESRQNQGDNGANAPSLGDH